MVRLAWVAGVVVAGMASPAWADHPVASAGGAGGAALNVASPDTLEAGAVAAGVRLAFTRPDRRSDAALEALAGAHVHAHDSDYSLNAVAGVSFGVTDRLTLSVELPYRRMDDLRAGEHSHHGGGVTNEVVRLGSVSGIGDLSVTAKYQVVASGPFRWALIGGVKTPTGATDETSAQGERLETEHQPGSGSWDAIAGVAMATGIGGLSLTASGVYQFTGEGSQDTELGDRAQVGVALSRRFGPADHHDDEHAEPHSHASWDAFVELTGEWEGRQAIAGKEQDESGGAVVWLSPGARFSSAGGWSIAGALGLPVWQDIRASHPENSYRLTLAVGRTF